MNTLALRRCSGKQSNDCVKCNTTISFVFFVMAEIQDDFCLFTPFFLLFKVDLVKSKKTTLTGNNNFFSVPSRLRKKVPFRL